LKIFETIKTIPKRVVPKFQHSNAKNDPESLYFDGSSKKIVSQGSNRAPLGAREKFHYFTVKRAIFRGI
jgi:hypothetical protein